MHQGVSYAVLKNANHSDKKIAFQRLYTQKKRRPHVEYSSTEVCANLITE